ncbi:PREDICTED: microtubule-associated serine/threonine-protein kinase 4-like [Aptenodytes forsteri]|uniref:microtubule-associated serine/threonine-protein kinase 4-like n=1 Tax=Aptenodytes forsteri TaxID=9233 RepID=UPI0004F4032A|nr:PREDICTED: microtubule-associated serine/threonine-protein kinase 4-like [Aptenodytes forsteri]
MVARADCIGCKVRWFTAAKRLLYGRSSKLKSDPLCLETGPLQKMLCESVVGGALDHILSPPPMPFRKSSGPEVSSGPGKSSKFKRQLSEDGRQLRRGSLGGALTGKYLLPNATGQQLWQPAETSNLVRMRYQALGQSAPSLTASLDSVLRRTWVYEA